MRHRLIPRSLQWSGSRRTWLFIQKAYTCTLLQLTPRLSSIIWRYSYEDSEWHARIVTINLPPFDWEVWSHTFLWFIFHYCQAELQISLYLKTREMDVSHSRSFCINSRSSSLNFAYWKKQKEENKTLDTLLPARKGEKQKCCCCLLLSLTSLGFFCFVLFFNPVHEKDPLAKKDSWDGRSRLQLIALLYSYAPYNLPRKTCSLAETDQWHPILTAAWKSGLSSSIYRSSR